MKINERTNEHIIPEINSQEAIRTLIKHTKRLYDIFPCSETTSAIFHLRMTLFYFEAKEWRRKKHTLNKKSSATNKLYEKESARISGFEDVPFTEFEIEKRTIGKDGCIDVLL